MCLAIPGQIVEVGTDRPDIARVDVSGVRRPINIGLLGDPPPAAGDWVLVHVGFALSRIDVAEARAVLELLKGVGQSYEDELEALRDSRID